MRRLMICLLLCAVASTGVAKAQSGTITGRINDPNGSGIAGAVIEYAPASNPDAKKFDTSAAGGVISLRGLAYGTYNLKISFLGYKVIEKTVRLSQSEARLGTMQFEEAATGIDAVNIDAVAIRTSQRGDTISYNANAFKVNADADVEGLLAKMPGITVSGGKVEAHGEEVKKVFLNGKEVFGDDVSAAISSIPADMVDRIEVFNKLSDDAEFTGIDDGNGYKALNIVTPANRRTARSGRIYGAWGVLDKYLAGAKITVINDESTVVLNGFLNNVNQQNFSFEDLLESSGGGGGFSSQGGRMWNIERPSDGIATAQAFAVNYNDVFGKLRLINGREQRPVKFSGNVSFRHLDVYNDSQTWRWDYLGAQNLYSETAGNSDNGRYEIRLGSRVEWTINESNTLMIRPSFNLQFSDGRSESLSHQYTITDPDNLLASPLMDYQNNSTSDRWGLNAGLYGNWRTRLSRTGRTLVFNFGGRYNQNHNLSYPEQWMDYITYNPSANDIIRVQKILSNTFGYSLSGGATYTEPLSKQSAVTLEYRAQYNYSDSERKAYLAEGLTALPIAPPYTYDPTYDEALSSIYNSGYLTNRITPGFRFNNEKFNFNVGLTYENARRTGDQTLPSAVQSDFSFNTFLYSAMMTWNINKTNMLRIRMNSWSQNPTINQLQNVIDLSSIRNITTGNPDLQPEYQHRIWANYVRSNLTRGTTLTLMASGGISNNAIGQALYTSGNVPGTAIAIPDGGYFSQPENMHGSWNAFGLVSYGFPVTWIKSNLTIGVNGYFSESPSRIDGERTLRSNNFYSADATLGSNISQNIDFTISYRAGYNNSTGTTVTNGTRITSPNNSFMQFATLSLKWVIWQGVTFSASATYTQNRGITDNYNDEYVLASAFLGKKFFKSQRLEISVGVNDIFDQNRSFRRSVQSTYIQNVQSLAIGRYVAIQFNYNLRSIGSTNNRPSNSDGQMGMPPGGGVRMMRMGN